MPRKVTVQEAASQIGAEIGADFNPNKKGFQKAKPRGGTAIRPLDALQRKALAQLKQKHYIYNVSPIFHWRRRASNVNFFIARRPVDKKVSVPCVVLPSADRLVIKGEGVAEHVITLGEDLVKDVLGLFQTPNKKGYNLAEAGCFYTAVPLESLPAEERETLIEDAEEAHRQYCSRKVLEADEWWGDPKTRGWIVKKHRDCAHFLNEDRDWVTRKAPPKAPPTEECVFCGYANKPGVVKCFNCKEILDKKKYAELQAGA